VQVSLTEIDEELNRLEANIRQLKIQYEQYFGGGRRRPPSDVEWQIEQVMKRYSDRGAEMNYTQRFRFGNLAQTYMKYRDVFRKRIQMREEGSTPKHFGAAARAIEAERQGSGKGQPSSVVLTCANPTGEREKVDNLYQAFSEALLRSGESTGKLSRETFEWFVKEKAAQFHKESGDKEVEFVVSLESGKARLKARVKS
jgi:hypothetical protein